MRVYGLDFTSTPSSRKPITCAVGGLEDKFLRLHDVLKLTTFKQFEEFLRRDGPWIAGIDFPFGLPRKLIEDLGWPPSWLTYVAVVADMKKSHFEEVLKNYQTGRRPGQKQLLRTTDFKADARSPMMLYGVPLAKMFFQGAPRLLQSGASVLPCHPTGGTRIVVEAYPALVARKWIGLRSYKSDAKAKQSEEQKLARRKLVEGLRSADFQAHYGFVVEMGEEEVAPCVEDPTGDLLDAILCAIQACWAYTQKQRRYGMPSECDPLEGWIVDPAQLRPQQAKPPIPPERFTTG
jgi:hypothetical protein